jgi:acetoacetyl-CoA synthetase
VPDAEFGFFLGSEAVSDAYRPGALDGDVTFYLAAGSRRALRQTLSAWRRRSRRLAVVGVPGHHGDVDDDRIGMLIDRHVRTLAARVGETLA